MQTQTTQSSHTNLRPGPWRAILGFKPRSRPSIQAVKRAHLALALKHHPDRGGSHTSMSILNDARDRAFSALTH